MGKVGSDLLEKVRIRPFGKSADLTFWECRIRPIADPFAKKCGSDSFGKLRIRPIGKSADPAYMESVDLTYWEKRGSDLLGK